MVLHIGLEDPVQHVVGRQRILIRLPGGQLRRGTGTILPGRTGRKDEDGTQDPRVYQL